jgi:hypothetical protein
MAEKLSIKALALSLGIIWALAMFLLGIAATYSSWGAKCVDTMGSLYIGYSASLVGSIIGAIWALIDGLICGALIAWLYNRFT